MRQNNSYITLVGYLIFSENEWHIGLCFYKFVCWHCWLQYDTIQYKSIYSIWYYIERVNRHSCRTSDQFSITMYTIYKFSAPHTHYTLIHLYHILIDRDTIVIFTIVSICLHSEWFVSPLSSNFKMNTILSLSAYISLWLTIWIL